MKTHTKISWVEAELQHVLQDVEAWQRNQLTTPELRKKYRSRTTGAILVQAAKMGYKRPEGLERRKREPGARTYRRVNKVGWTSQEKSTIKQDWTAFKNGEMTTHDLRQKYDGRSIHAIGTGWYRYSGAPNAAHTVMSRGRSQNGNGHVVKPIPKFFRGIYTRLARKGFNEIQIKDILLGPEVTLTQNDLPKLNQMIKASDVLIKVDNGQVKFERVQV